MRVVIIFIAVAVLFSSCSRRKVEVFERQQLISDLGWDIVSLTVYCSVYDEENDAFVSGARYNYKKVGHLTFLEDNTGIYIYDGAQYRFTWEIFSGNSLQIIFDADLISDYTAPFIFYSFFEGDFNNPIQSNRYHKMESMTKNSIICSNSNSDFVISKVL